VKPTRAAVVAALSVALVGASSSGVVARAATRTRTPATTRTLPPTAAVTWSDCGNGFQCATLSVPVDWRVPEGDRVALALTRHPATGPEPRVGALVVNYGGPGNSGVHSLQATWARLPQVVRDRFDVVSWDPRGTGASRPIDCLDDPVLDQSTALPAVPDTPDALTAVRGYEDALAQGCRDRMGDYAGQVGTRNTARDLEAIRRAIGEPLLTFLGYSYGAIVGATYAQMFPRAVRAMVLDGAPDWWASRTDYAYAQAQGFQHALTAFLDWCAQAPACALRQAGDPHTAFNDLVARVARDPLPATYRAADGTVRDGVLTGTMLETGAVALLYDEARGWPLLGQALRSAAQDGWGGPLLADADQYLGRAPDGAWSSLTEANAVIFCDDRPDRLTATFAQDLTLVQRFQAALPPWGGTWAVDTCRGMPLPSPGDRLGRVEVRGVRPVLVVGTTGDPAAPYAGAEAMHTRIAGSTLLTFDSTEHTAYGTGRSACVDEAVDAYLVAGTVPPAGTRCAPG
jgi:pimeloyl-ACP methyl ester carboxylesterase